MADNKVSFDLVRQRYNKQKQRWSTRNQHYQILRKLFAGDFSTWWNEGQVPDRLSLVFNYVQPIVQKHASFLVADPPDFSVPAPSPKKTDRLAAAKAEKVLYKIHQANHSERVFMQAAIESALLGTAWVKMYVEKEGKEPKAVRYCYARPEYVYPEIYQSVYTEQFRYVIYAYQISVDDAREEYGNDVRTDRQLEYDEEAKKQKSDELTTVIEHWTKDNYALMVGGLEVENGDNPYGLIPFIPLPFLTDPGQVHGCSVVENIIGANRYFNLLTSRKGDSIRMHCNPPLVYKGATFTSREDFTQDIEGGVHFVGENQDINMLTWPGEPPTVTEQQNRVMKFIYDASYMPEAAFAYGDRAITGIAMKLTFDPLIKVQRQVRDNWSVALQQLNSGLLRLTEEFLGSKQIVEAEFVGEGKDGKRGKKRLEKLTGADVAGLYETEVIWPGVLPKDDIAAAKFEIEKKKGNLQSIWTTMEKLGVSNPADELEIIREEMEDPLLHPTEQSTMLGAAAKGLAAIQKGGVANPDRGVVPGEPGPIAGPPTGPEEADRAWEQSEGAGDESAMFRNLTAPEGPVEGIE